jgi:hypothetical protein
LCQIIVDADVVDRDFLSINLDMGETSALNDDSREPRELLQVAFNIFSKAIVEDRVVLTSQLFEQEQPIQNLKTLHSVPKSNIFVQLEQRGKVTIINTS